MNLSDEQKEKMWKELSEIAKARRGEKMAHEKTIKEFAIENDVSIDFARKFLREQEKQGKLACRWITLDGTRRKVYSPINSN